MNNTAMIKVGGWSIIAFALLYLGMQLYLFIAFDYPALLHGPGKEVFPLLLAGGLPLQLSLAIFSLLPMLLIPASVGAYYGFRDKSEGSMRLGVLFATIAAFGFMLCIMVWPSLNWYLARFYGGAGPEQQAVVSAIFAAINDYFGAFIGGFLSKVCLTIWFFIVSAAMLRAKEFPRWMGYLGIIAGVYELLTLFDIFNMLAALFVSSLRMLAPIEFLWLMVFGVGLLFYKTPVKD